MLVPVCLGAGPIWWGRWETWVTTYILSLSENGSEGREVKRRVQPSPGAPGLSLRRALLQNPLGLSVLGRPWEGMRR